MTVNLCITVRIFQQAYIILAWGILNNCKHFANIVHEMLQKIYKHKHRLLINSKWGRLRKKYTVTILFDKRDYIPKSSQVKYFMYSARFCWNSSNGLSGSI